MSTLYAYFFLFLRCYALCFVFPALRAHLRQSGLVVVGAALAMTVGSKCFSGAMEIHCATVLSLIALSFRELVIGAMIGLPLSIALEAFLMSARIIDVTRGAQFAEQLLPDQGIRVSQLENVAVLLTLLLCVTSGGYQFVLLGLSKSVTSSALAVGGSGFLMPDLSGIIQLSQEAITTGLLLASPVVIAMFLLDLVSGILSRALGRINIHYELMPVKMIAGVFICAWLLVEMPNGAPEVLRKAMVMEAEVVLATNNPNGIPTPGLSLSPSLNPSPGPRLGP